MKLYPHSEIKIQLQTFLFTGYSSFFSEMFLTLLCFLLEDNWVGSTMEVERGDCVYHILTHNMWPSKQFNLTDTTSSFTHTAWMYGQDSQCILALRAAFLTIQSPGQVYLYQSLCFSYNNIYGALSCKSPERLYFIKT